MTIHERFAALPRARKGSTTVVIVEESVLSELIADAQASEGDLMKRSVERTLTHITGGATGGAPMVIHVDPPPPPSAAVLAGPAMEMRIKLSEEARDLLQERCPGLFADQPILEREWRELEDALTEIMFTEIMFPPQRFVTGLPR